jgi:hypothetical protein
MSKKYYCYIDETGQDTQGKIFILAGFIRRVVENDNKMIYLYKKVVNKKIIEV